MRSCYLILPCFFIATSAFQIAPITRTFQKPLRKKSENPSLETGTPKYRTILYATPLLQLKNAVSSPFSLALPTCAAGNELRVAAVAGVIAVASQLAVFSFLKRSKDSVYNENAAYTAHSIVAFGLMILVSSVGLYGWFNPSCSAGFTTATSRLLQPSQTGRWLAAVIAGSFVCWDLPTSIGVKSLRKPDVIAHHICTALIAIWGATIIPMHYILFYLGVAEFSSIPLVVYDQLAQNMRVSMNDGNTKRHDSFQKLHDFAQLLAAISFTVVRAFGFTKVTLVNFLPDCWIALKSNAVFGVTRPILKALMFFSVAFTSLQLYWFSGILKVVFSSNGDDEDEIEGVAL